MVSEKLEHIFTKTYKHVLILVLVEDGLGDSKSRSCDFRLSQS